MRFLLLLLWSSAVFAGTTSIKDPIQDYQMTVNSNGSINTNSTFTPPTVSTAVITNVTTISGSSVTVVAANPNRLGLMIFDLSATACFIAFDAVASNTLFSFKMYPMHNYVMDQPIYRGAVSAYCNDGNLLITEE